MQERNYSDFFNIDQEYFPAATEELINKGIVDWKKFYPHDTFIKLIKDAITVLSRNQKLSLWVEGAYGTGKSHAVLTLDKLLTCDEEETRAYFNDYENLKDDLLNELIGLKKRENIITVRRYNSSSIMNDNDLIIAIQESILDKLKKLGISNVANTTFKDSIIEWLSDPASQVFFDAVISKEQHKGKFDVDAKTFLENLKNSEGDILAKRIDKILDIADELPSNVTKLSMGKLIEWIKGVLEHDEVGSIFFIWDEFSEYFKNNKNRLTGFQELVEMTQTNKFYMCIVTHRSGAILDDKDSDKNKILGRFLNPTCEINLPDNMAFELMSQAMRKTSDETLLQEWNDIVTDLEMRTSESRVKVNANTKIEKKVLSNILPIHPFSALYLKYVATLLSSNQRSMFDFIKNNRGNEGIKGLPWYLDNYGPYSDEPILTVDMLWEFVYERGKGNLSRNAEYVLNNYNLKKENLNDVEEKVYKAILLMQALSEETRDSSALLISNEENLNLAFRGSAIDTAAVAIADNLAIEKKIISKQLTKSGNKYTVLQIADDSDAIETIREEIKKNFKLSEEIRDREFDSILNLRTDLKSRYKVFVSAFEDLDKNISTANLKTTELESSIVFTFAKDENEAIALEKKILEKYKQNENIIFVDTSINPLGLDDLNQYIEYKTHEKYYRPKDKKSSDDYAQNAKDILNGWKQKLSNSDFKIYTKTLDGKRANLQGTHSELRRIVKNKFSKCLDDISSKDTMFQGSSFKMGAEAGISQINKAQFDSNFLTSFGGAINIEKYWLNENSTFKFQVIKEMKLAIDQFIQDEFNKNGRVSINDIYDLLKGEPYGLLPIALSAYTFGFMLKEYSDSSFSWSDGRITKPMDIQKLSESINTIFMQNLKGEILKNDNNHFIVMMTDKEKSFLNLTCNVFNILPEKCASIESARDSIRDKMKNLKFPIIYLKGILENVTNLKTDINILSNIIDCYVGLVNTENISGVNSEVDLANKIGELASINKNIQDDLKLLFTETFCIQAMIKHFEEYNAGELFSLSKKLNISDPLELLKDKLREDSTWLWNSRTINNQMDHLFIELEIVDYSNTILNLKESDYRTIIQRWIDKTNTIKVPYDVTKNIDNDLNDVLAIIYNIKKTNEIKENDKKGFAENLKLKSDSLIEYFDKSYERFLEINKPYIDELSSNDCRAIYDVIGNSVYTSTAENYYALIKENVNKMRINNNRSKVKDLWEIQTKSKTPMDWSNKNKMPIEAVFEDTDFNEGQEIVQLFNKYELSESDIIKFESLMKNNTSMSKITDSTYLNERFIKVFLSEYSNILTDVDDVKNYLSKNLTLEPSKWFSNPSIQNKIKEYAEQEYKTNDSFKKVSNIVDNMNEVELKMYLKQLIEKDIKLGMKILIGKQ